MEKYCFPRWIEVSPSVIWFAFIILPMLLQSPPLGTIGFSTHFFCVVFVLIVFSACDAFVFFSPSCAYDVISVRDRTSPQGENIILFLAVVFVLLSVYNIYLMPEIPIVKSVMGINRHSSEIANSRMMATKSLGAPRIVLYGFNWALLVIAPLLVVMLVSSKRFIQSFLVFILAILYGMLTTAKLPSMMMFFCLLFSMACTFRKFAVTIYKFVIICCIVFWVIVTSEILINFSVLYGNEAQRFDTKYHSSDPRFNNTISDRIRIMGSLNKGKDASILDGIEDRARYLVYRMWLTPSDVSMRWFQYYTINNSIGLMSTVEASGTNHAPSRSVGIWAYVDKFPQYYLSSINAYASFDADAFSRGGITGVIVATMILGLCRILLFLFRNKSVLGSSAYGIGIALLTVLPIQSSVQAILVANGLLVVMLILGITKLCQKMTLESSKC